MQLCVPLLLPTLPSSVRATCWPGGRHGEVSRAVDSGGLLDGGDFRALCEPVYDFILRKLAHLTVFAVLTVLLFRAVRLHVARPTHAWLLAMLVATLYACSDEWHQTFVPGRDGTVRDIVIDSLGVVGVWALASRTRLREMLPRWLAEEV